MPLTRDLRRARFTASGPDAEPTGPEWMLAPAKERKAYFDELARLLFEERRKAHLKAEDWRGDRMPRRRRKRRDGATGPVLVPHHGDSRFITKLRYRGSTNAAEVWYARDWWKPVRGQRERFGRDVVGV
jgi:hypothetical protein